MPDLHFLLNAKQRQLWLSGRRLAMGETSWRHSPTMSPVMWARCLLRL